MSKILGQYVSYLFRTLTERLGLTCQHQIANYYTLLTGYQFIQMNSAKLYKIHAYANWIVCIAIKANLMDGLTDSR